MMALFTQYNTASRFNLVPRWLVLAESTVLRIINESTLLLLSLQSTVKWKEGYFMWLQGQIRL